MLSLKNQINFIGETFHMYTLQRAHSFSEKVSNGAEKMAQRMGGQFVRNERWGNIAAANTSGVKVEIKKQDR